MRTEFLNSATDSYEERIDMNNHVDFKSRFYDSALEKREVLMQNTSNSTFEGVSELHGLRDSVGRSLPRGYSTKSDLAFSSSKKTSGSCGW